jgi:hypothetical protein
MQAELYSQILIWPLKIEPEPTAGDWIDSLEKFMTAASAWHSGNDLLFRRSLLRFYYQRHVRNIAPILKIKTKRSGGASFPVVKVVKMGLAF